ncbi:MAG: hypothetical protein ACLQVI_14810 [Polyangiaceae bacterium]|jgi:hypothetical protein
MTTTFHDSESALTRRQELLARTANVLDYLFGLLYALLAIRLVLELIGARKGTGFVEFIVALTSAFYAPFKGIVANDSLDRSHPIVWPIVIAIVAYMLLHAAVRALLRLVDRA